MYPPMIFAEFGKTTKELFDLVLAVEPMAYLDIAELGILGRFTCGTVTLELSNGMDIQSFWFQLSFWNDGNGSKVFSSCNSWFSTFARGWIHFNLQSTLVVVETLRYADRLRPYIRRREREEERKLDQARDEESMGSPVFAERIPSLRLR